MLLSAPLLSLFPTSHHGWNLLILTFKYVVNPSLIPFPTAGVLVLVWISGLTFSVPFPELSPSFHSFKYLNIFCKDEEEEEEK